MALIDTAMMVFLIMAVIIRLAKIEMLLSKNYDMTAYANAEKVYWTTNTMAWIAIFVFVMNMIYKILDWLFILKQYFAT